MKWEKATCSEEAHHQDGCGVSSRSPQNRIHTEGFTILDIPYTFAVAILTALLFGLVPAVTASQTAPNHTLASGSQQAAGSRRQSFMRRALVVGELAIALVFLTGAGLVRVQPRYV